MEYFSATNFIIGIFGLIIGIVLIKEAFTINHHWLFLGWAEQKWGPGSGTLAYRIIGVGILIFSLLVMGGQIDLSGSNLVQDQRASGSGGNTVIPSSQPTSPIKIAD